MTKTRKCDTMDTEKALDTVGYNKNKRQVYIWPENKAFFDKLPNKSKFLNLLIKQYRQRVSDESLKKVEDTDV